MSWTVEDIPDQRGRTAVVTGANGGLGLEVARALASRGAHVVMASRNQEKARAAEEDIRSSNPDASVEVRELDLASLESVGAFTGGARRDFESIDILVNNAGVMGIPEHRTDDGFEMQFGVNHLGHYALTAQLLGLMVTVPGSRIVGVTSTARHFGRPVDPANPHLDGKYEPWRAYGQSKLANLHFAIGLETRLRKAGATTQSLISHPGLSNTDLQSHSVRATDGGASQRFFEMLAQTTGMTARRGALPILRAATDPEASGGELYAPRFANTGAAVRRPLIGRSLNSKSIETLFEVSARETGVSLDVEKAIEDARL
jgi:NAD(P)-dependent dehydrogenase (short-subunit alcohol dehydrogenase family)